MVANIRCNSFIVSKIVENILKKNSIIFPRKWDLVFHMNCLSSRQFTWNVVLFSLKKKIQRKKSKCHLLQLRFIFVWTGWWAEYGFMFTEDTFENNKLQRIKKLIIISKGIIHNKSCWIQPFTCWIKILADDISISFSPEKLINISHEKSLDHLHKISTYFLG